MCSELLCRSPRTDQQQPQRLGLARFYLCRWPCLCVSAVVLPVVMLLVVLVLPVVVLVVLVDRFQKWLDGPMVQAVVLLKPVLPVVVLVVVLVNRFQQWLDGPKVQADVLLRPVFPAVVRCSVVLIMAPLVVVAAAGPADTALPCRLL